MTPVSGDTYGTVLICDALSAYRRDLSRTPDVVRFGDDDARWLRVALKVEQVTGGAVPRRARALKLAALPILHPGKLLRTVERMEAAGALTLAYATLASARRVWDTADPSSAGTAIFRQARICRTSGETVAAENFYTYLYIYATKHRLAELRGRALVGRGMLRLVGGDARAGLRWFGKARSSCGNNLTATAVAWHAEMAGALAIDDLSRAVIAGRKALDTRALGSYDEAGVLVNMASIALRAGRPRAAFQSAKLAMKASRHPRVRMLVYSKAAGAAAALGKSRTVQKMASLFTATAARVNIPLEELEARSEIAAAFATVGDMTRARRLARSVREEAKTAGLEIIAQRCDAILGDAVENAPHTTPVMLSAPAQRVVAALEMA